MHNAVSFLISGEMNMYEQQSSYNPNMPLRMLQYASSLYEKDLLSRKKNKYSRTLVSLPVPKLVVFYNGRDEEPDEQTLRLSDAFAEELRDEADIAVRVRMININAGRSPGMMRACEPLNEYAWIIDRIRTYEQIVGLEEAIDRSIDEMPARYKLKPYLDAHREEVKNMLLTEYNETAQMELFREEGRAMGRAEGRTEGENRMGALISWLLKAGRNADALKVIQDPGYREQMYQEMGLSPGNP